jgi:hypothetical protein
MTKNDDFSQMAYGPYTGSTLLVWGSQIVKQLNKFAEWAARRCAAATN